MKSKEQYIVTSPSKLRGDIIQYHDPTYGLPWNLCYWSHTLLYIGDGEVIHASGKGVQKSNLDEIFKSHPNIDNHDILRVKNVTETTIDKVIEFAEEKIDQPYDMWSLYHLTKQVDPSLTHPGYGYYCTELVWAAYLSATNKKVNLDTNKIGWINPMEIFLSRHIDRIYIMNLKIVDRHIKIYNQLIDLNKEKLMIRKNNQEINVNVL